MQRRVWIQTAHSILYPNLYILLVSPPGVGKSQAISRVGALWVQTKNVHVAPDSVTKASLIDALARATVKVNDPKTQTFQVFNALTVPAGEFGVLVPAHDLEFLSNLNTLYDCPPYYREERRSRSDKQIDIPFPMLNILGGTQPAYLSSLLPEQAWGMGFTSRLIMVYSGQPTKINLFDVPPIDTKLEKSLGSDLLSMTTIYGQMSWAPSARSMMEAWAKTGFEPIPLHSRLQNYNTRRVLHIMKLCMISSVSRSTSLIIDVDDVQRAQDWLIAAEDRMPDIFREMAGKSDKQIIDDLHDYMWRMFTRDKKPLHESRVIGFLSTKVPADKVFRLMELCERSGVIERDKTTANCWRPSVKDNIPGVE